MLIQALRTTELQMSIAVLKIASERADGYVTLNELREEIPHRVELTEGDKQPSMTRPGEMLWEQLLRNIRSHHKSTRNFINLGYLEHFPGGAYRITEKGREALRQYEAL